MCRSEKKEELKNLLTQIYKILQVPEDAKETKWSGAVDARKIFLHLALQETDNFKLIAEAMNRSAGIIYNLHKGFKASIKTDEFQYKLDLVEEKLNTQSKTA